MFNKFLKKDKWIGIVILLMFLLSSFFTVKVLIFEATTFLDLILLGGMGLSIQSSIAISAIYLVNFIKLRKKFLLIIALIALIGLTYISITCNIEYTNSINSNKQEQTKTMTEEYKRLNEEKKRLNDRLNEENDRLNDIELGLNEENDRLNDRMNDKKEGLSKVDNVWKVSELSKQYDKDIDMLNDSINRLNENKNNQSTFIQSMNDSFKVLNDEISTTTKYVVEKNSFTNNGFRKFIGIFFELLSIIFFIFKSCTLEEVENKKKSNIVSEDNIIPNIKNKEEKSLQDIYLDYIKTNLKEDTSIPSDKEVIENLKISKYSINNIKKNLYNKGTIKKDKANSKKILLVV